MTKRKIFRRFGIFKRLKIERRPYEESEKTIFYDISEIKLKLKVLIYLVGTLILVFIITSIINILLLNELTKWLKVR